MQIKFDVKLVRFYAMCAASAWSKQCILVHFVFALTLRCLLPDWQYKQKNAATALYVKGFVIFYLSFFFQIQYVSPDLLNLSLQLPRPDPWPLLPSCRPSQSSSKKLLSTLHTNKCKLEILQNFVAFSEYINFKSNLVKKSMDLSVILLGA